LKTFLKVEKIKIKPLIIFLIIIESKNDKEENYSIVIYYLPNIK